jgi:hypothetical protein
MQANKVALLLRETPSNRSLIVNISLARRLVDKDQPAKESSQIALERSLDNGNVDR